MTSQPAGLGAQSTPASPLRAWLPALLTKLGPVLGLVFVVGLFGALRPGTFLTMGNVQLMLLQTTVVGTAALGMTLIIIAGGIDLSVGSTIALTTVVIATLLAKLAGDADAANIAAMPALLAALGGVAVAALAGLVIGLLVTRLKLMPFIVTLATWGAIRGGAKGAAHEQTVQAPESWINTMLAQPGEESQWMIVAPGVWMLLVLSVVTAAALRYTRFGRHVFAIGSNEQTARLCGVRVERTKTLIYTIAGVFFGLAGVLQFSYLSVGDPTTASGLELDIIAAVVIGGASLSGGRGSVTGSLIGALIMTAVANGCTKCGLSNWVQAIVTGGIILLAVGIDKLRRAER